MHFLCCDPPAPQTPPRARGSAFQNSVIMQIGIPAARPPSRGDVVVVYFTLLQFTFSVPYCTCTSLDCNALPCFYFILTFPLLYFTLLYFCFHITSLYFTLLYFTLTLLYFHFFESDPRNGAVPRIISRCFQMMDSRGMLDTHGEHGLRTDNVGSLTRSIPCGT